MQRTNHTLRTLQLSIALSVRCHLLAVRLISRIRQIAIIHCTVGALPRIRRGLNMQARWLQLSIALSVRCHDAVITLSPQTHGKSDENGLTAHGQVDDAQPRVPEPYAAIG
jgi:hypothetical protein